MSLSDRQLERYARQVIIPGLGADGQERLLASRVAILGPVEQRAVAATYLSRAGVQVNETTEAVVDCVVACSIEQIDDTDLHAAAERAPCLIWYTLDGRSLTTGILRPYDGLRPSCRSRSVSDPIEPALAALAACDAAASAISVLLNWPSDDSTREHRFA
jgi:hypothetical protein